VTFRITPEDLKFYNSNLEYDLGTGGIHHPHRWQFKPVEGGVCALAQAGSSSSNRMSEPSIYR
jgi:hypothetical protein